MVSGASAESLQCIADTLTEDVEYVTLTRVGRTIRKDQAFIFIRREYAKAFRGLAKIVLPQSELSTQLSETATIILSKNRQYILKRTKQTWEKLMDRAIKAVKDEYDEFKDVYEKFKREEDEKDFDSTILMRAKHRYSRATGARIARKKLLGDLEEHLGDD